MKAARSSVVSKKGTPWGTIIAVVAIVALAASVVTYYMIASAPKRDQKTREEAAAAFAPSQQDPDPSKRINGVTTTTYEGSVHVTATERVAYDKTPPYGGPHDQSWAACNGVVYPNAVRNENMVHGLEHGAVWIAYNPQQITGEALDLLKVRVEGKPYTTMSPYPNLDKPISLQSWGHQLKLDSASDERIDQFIAALRTNPYGAYPERDATCDAQIEPGEFDATPPGPDAKPMDYKGTAGTQQDGQPGAGQPSQPPATQPSAPASK
ncbi:DUF3105 domain-containing protein [Amycolatopsis pittospori]|uniref:DUF3105 domain-containing protein n=1 Tax=Amycolatopsis pittospori TaxID=2749434 RepID=UPI0015F03893|nr:DUF3105 domain-containing protein [Amycolatopsis pittospori]